MTEEQRIVQDALQSVPNTLKGLKGDSLHHTIQHSIFHIKHKIAYIDGVIPLLKALITIHNISKDPWITTLLRIKLSLLTSRNL